MKVLKFAIAVFMVLFTLHSASAALVDNLHSYLTFDNADYTAPTLRDAYNSYDWDNTAGTQTGVIGLIAQAFNWTAASNEYVSYQQSNLDYRFLKNGSSWSFNVWIKLYNPNHGGVYTLLSQQCGATTNNGLDILIDDRAGLGQPRGIYALMGNGAAQVITAGARTNVYQNTQAWQMLTFTYDHSLASENLKAYSNTVYVANWSKTGNAPSLTAPRTNTTLGADCVGVAPSLYYDEEMDEAAFYSGKVLNSSEISALYNGGAGYRPYSTPACSANVAYTGYVSYGGADYVRSLDYNVSVECPSWAANNTVTFKIDGVDNLSFDINVSMGGNGSYAGTYAPSSEGAFNVTFYINSTDGNLTGFYGAHDFVADLYAPQIYNISFNIIEGFNFNSGTNVTLRCTDTIMSNLTYNLTFNGVNLYNGTQANNTLLVNASTLQNGNNEAVGVCADLFGYTTSSYSALAYLRTLYLIDERENTDFDVNNLTIARVYYDDNSTLYDFLANNKTSVNLTSAGNVKLRFELGEYAEETIARYIDMSLIEEQDLRVCANKANVKHYEQLIISAREREVALKNVFSNCYVALDYTRFAYQDAYLLKAYTINSLYYIYKYDSGASVYLASVDGSVATYINLDTLEFTQTAYDIDFGGESLAFERYSNNTVLIAYQNLANSSDWVNIQIINMNTSATVFNANETASPNNFNVYFDWSTLAGVTNLTMFQIVLTKHSGDSVSYLKRYFNVMGSSGIIGAGFAFILAICLLVFGLTFTITRLSLGWFGLIMEVASIAVLSLTTLTWYVYFFMGVNVVVMFFTIVLIMKQNYGAIA